MQIFLNFILLIVGFVILIKGADWFVDGASMIAQKMKVPQIVIGLTIVAMGTSLPEAAVSITAAVSGGEGGSAIALGNILGSNIANVLLILGICAIITPLAIQKYTLWIEIPFVIVVTAVLLFLGTMGSGLSRIDGAVFLVVFVLFLVYLGWLSKKSKENQIEELQQPSSPKKTWLLVVMIIIGIGMTIGGSRLIVDSATKLATYWGINEAFIGLTIVAIGTSLPELVTSLVAAKKKNADLAIGNIVGSNIFNMLFILGLTSVISPIQFASSFVVDNIVAIVAMLALWLLIIFTKKKNLGRIGGVILLIAYASYLTYLIVAVA